MQKKHMLLLSALLATSLLACASLNKKPASDLTAQRDAAVGEEKKENDAEENVYKDFIKSGSFNIYFRHCTTIVKTGWSHFEETARWETSPEWERLMFQIKNNPREYRQWTDANLVHHIEIRGPTDNPYFYVAQTALNKTKIILLDKNGDGKIDIKIKKSPGTGIYIIERDSDGDGVLDKRVTNTVTKNAEGFINHRVFEKRNPDGNWKKILERTEGIKSEEFVII